jgi:hypothetical protein
MAKWLVLGDLHGALDAAFALVPNAEACLGVKIAGILQAGEGREREG